MKTGRAQGLRGFAGQKKIGGRHTEDGQAEDGGRRKGRSGGELCRAQE